MKLKLNKKKLKNLSKDSAALPVEMTPQVGGGIPTIEPTTALYLGCNTGACFSGKYLLCPDPA
ncbi:hypothetical protein [Pseudoalteromonas denitrificans]|jgi:hypothetical protein|uniref:Uncharacterized protein n=1 Tax=Pseudoalteromonas denitrificans DSM 6059 TaxID=1123010 RepID=A0A1I1UFB1_9GAMM|nr:hypothetical protein [Pseudoalteromonas denitrificans]SFD69536.1 hypothetical protein SAMN02745724_05219 [Pseudoalteromonas denitrificans DSM 6059]